MSAPVGFSPEADGPSAFEPETPRMVSLAALRWVDEERGSSVATMKIAVLPGDGIGVEVVAEGLKVLERIGEIYGHTFQFTEALIGWAAIDATGSALPE